MDILWTLLYRHFVLPLNATMFAMNMWDLSLFVDFNYS
jgi:hypothetical protein